MTTHGYRLKDVGTNAPYPDSPIFPTAAHAVQWAVLHNLPPVWWPIPDVAPVAIEDVAA